MRRYWTVLVDAVDHLSNDDGFALASHVSLTALMSVFPFLIFVGALAGFIGEAGLADQVAALLFETWPDDVAEPIANDVRQVLTNQSTGLLTVSVLIMIYLASNGVEAVRTALNRAYRVPDTRSFIHLRLQSVGFVILGAIASLTLAFVGVLGPTLFNWAAEHFPNLAPYQTIFDYARFGVTGVMVIFVLVSAHVWLPAGRPPLRRLWPGIAVTVVLWSVAAWGFGFYLQRFAHYATYYAGLASVFTALVFMYLVALIMIFGAELNASLARIGHRRMASRGM
ncbi:YihY/virulence factor BrkB family protein [Bauldia sp.]|uniref:YihY/virulence factor BrkB family protein n=1 Tax=Bauldia sp. TaxID=2575872 RepID=UPI003BAC4A91